jgi:hypothetical protein
VRRRPIDDLEQVAAQQRFAAGQTQSERSHARQCGEQHFQFRHGEWQLAFW